MSPGPMCRRGGSDDIFKVMCCQAPLHAFDAIRDGIPLEDGIAVCRDLSSGQLLRGLLAALALVSLGGLICEQVQVLHMLRGDRALYYAPFRVSRCMCCAPWGGQALTAPGVGKCACAWGLEVFCIVSVRARASWLFFATRGCWPQAAALFLVAGCSRDRVPTLQSRHSSGAQSAPQHAGSKLNTRYGLTCVLRIKEALGLACAPPGCY